MTNKKRKLSVLIIEDNAEFAKLLQRMLKSEKNYTFETTLCSTVSSGMEELKKNEIDAILLDINLPDSNGIDTLKKVNSRSGNIPILVLTGSTNENLMNEGINLGVQDFLIKGEVGNKTLIRSIIIAIERYKVIKNRFISSQFDIDEKYFQKIIKNSADAMLVLDKKGYVLYSNEAADELFSKNNEDLKGKNFSYPYDSEAPSEIEIINNDGESLIFEMRNTEIELLGETVFITSFRDMTDRKMLENKLRDLSNSDDVTNLLNRRGFEFLANQHYKVALRSKSPFLIAIFDLDGLKNINDTHGHIEGTRSIIETSRILVKTFRNSDLLARWGGDEFIVLGINTTESFTSAILNRLEKNIDEFNQTKKLPESISLSVGFSYYDPENPQSLEQLIKEADERMYVNKKSKKKAQSIEKQLNYNFNNGNIASGI